ncbi:arsenite-activated ATPase ArsA [Salinarchaeum sp. Harcht-Bsk1]|uniref:ArsA family ATPase n=1 Tax=Salinarchaeum sp. Harcht-Bsk1 TaxID=1333523 RepID=UPI00034244AB|nr:TRC40/GET3/ArsA family transport-energizing ATPase [Salinarchaeum sp. Harcht-Bsk1]AGN01816.1 arsenite-activated ATPase ArsA [Salinarchaeum sp. Harcht-Bsk1]
MKDIDVEPVDDVDADDDGPGDPHATDGPDDATDEEGGPASPGDGSTDADAPADHSALDADRLPPVASDTPEFVLYGGKGGVGKTTMAAATGLASAAAGTRTLVVSTDPAHSLSDTYETAIGAEPTRLRGDLPLYAAEIDPDAAMEEGMSMFGDQAGTGGAGGPTAGGAEGAGGPGGADASGGGPFDPDASGGQGPAGGMGGLGAMMGGDSPLQSMLGGTMPGSDEAVAMQQLVEFMDDDRFDRVVVDTAPTGHTLRLLELPELMDTMVGRILSMREKLSGLFDGLSGMFGGEDADAEAGTQSLRELSDRIERLRETLTDPALTDFRIVMVPEELSVIESERLLRQLDDFSIPVETVVVNKVMEDLADVTGEVPADDVVTPNLEDCEFCQRRWDVQQRALTRAQEVFRGRSIERVPLLAEEVRGEQSLRVVAACLE